MEILQNARAQSNLIHENTAEYIYGDAQRLAEIRQIREKLKAAGIKKDPRVFEMSRVDLITHVVKTSVEKYIPNTSGNGLGFPAELLFEDSIFPIGSIGSMMNTALIDILATDEQKAVWLERIGNWSYLSCYAQTELAHGSDVQNLQTLATYDNATQEFVFHTPNVGAIKWWPGDLGLFSTHAIVFARLVSNGVDHGVQSFFVELRDPDTHIPREGVEVGDIGPKLGYAAKDNGFLRFTKYRAPKSCLLAKFLSIDENGDLKRTGNPKAMYSGMMKARTVLVTASAYRLMKGCLIGVRYSHVRRQFKDTEGQEIPIFRYQLQKQKLVDQVSRALCMTSAAAMIRQQVAQCTALAQKGDFSMLQDVHISLCVHKAFFTEWSTYGLTHLIRACGGHGYSHFSGLPSLLTDGFPDMILEGENTVLFLQVSRALLGSLKLVQAGKGKSLGGSFKYLNQIGQDQEPFVLPEEKDALKDLSVLLRAFESASANYLVYTGKKMQQLLARKINPKVIWDYHLGSSLQELGQIHGIYSILRNFIARIQAAKDANLASLLRNLAVYFALNEIKNRMKIMLMGGIITQDHVSIIKEIQTELLEEIAPHMLSLLEGLEVSDETLMSAIGHSNGKPYENLYNLAKEIGQLNQLENGVHPAMREYYLPFRQRQLEKLWGKARL